MPFQYKVLEDKKVRIIIDTDAACEADDPFAIAHALMCQKFDVNGYGRRNFDGFACNEKRSSRFYGRGNKNF